MRERGGAPGRTLRGDDVAFELAGAPLVDARGQHLEAARDPSQQVVEVMREPAGELTHGLHLLRLAQVILRGAQRLGLFLLGRDVTPGRHDGGTVRHRRPADPAIAAIAMPIAVLEVPQGDRATQSLHALRRVGEVLGMNQAGDLLADQLRWPPSQHGGPGRVDGDDGRVAVEHDDEIRGQFPEAVAVGRPLHDLAFERQGEFTQRDLGASALDGDARPLRDLAHQRDLVRGPDPGPRVVEEEQGHQARLFRHRKVQHGTGRDRLERRGAGGGARVEPGVREGHQGAAPQILDVGAVVAEMQHAGEARDAGRVPVAGDRDGLRREVDRPVSGPAHAEHPAQDLGGGLGEFVRVVDVADRVAELNHRGAAVVGELAGGDVERHAGHPQRAPGAVARDARPHVDPADAPVGGDDAIFDVVVLAGLDAARPGEVPRRAVVRVDAGFEIADREGLRAIPSEVLLGDPRRGQLAGTKVLLPDAEPPRLGGEVQPGRVLLLDVEPVRDLCHEGGIVAFEPFDLVPLDRDVDLAGEEIGELSRGVPDRRHQQPVPEGLARLAIVENVEPDGLPVLHGGADLRHGLRVGLGALQETAVPADDLLARIAGEPAERVVDEDDRVVRQAGIRDHHRHAGRPHGRREGVRAVVDAGDLLDDAGGIAGRIGRDGPTQPHGLGFQLRHAPAEALELRLRHGGRPDTRKGRPLRAWRRWPAKDCAT